MLFASYSRFVLLWPRSKCDDWILIMCVCMYKYICTFHNFILYKGTHMKHLKWGHVNNGFFSLGSLTEFKKPKPNNKWFWLFKTCCLGLLWNNFKKTVSTSRSFHLQKENSILKNISQSQSLGWNQPQNSTSIWN